MGVVAPKGAGSVKNWLLTAESEKDLQVQRGMTPTLLGDLGRMVSDLDAAIEGIRTGRPDHTGARADLGVITSER